MAALFTVVGESNRLPAAPKSQAFLLPDNWNDWFTFSTMYTLVYFDESSIRHDCGSVKIGERGMCSGRANVPGTFDQLDDAFFSLGQDTGYYETLNELGAEVRDQILEGLNDVAVDLERFASILKETVTGESLLRSVARSTVQGQFNRMSRGGARLTRYKFSYTAPPGTRNSDGGAVTLSFAVKPESMPPSNIHVLIGRNGVGKTHLLNNMSQALTSKRPNPDEVGKFIAEADFEGDDLFANLVSVTFSAFDPFEPLPNRRDRSEGLPCAYVGLKKSGSSASSQTPSAPKSPLALAREFGASVQLCSRGARRNRWRAALEILAADPIFRAADVASLAAENLDEDEIKERARKLYKGLSSGHKIVLLTITRLVETVEERTLVLIDEPESHLHPPLLAAFVRALSDLLIDRNGVAIIATHSPVILQEVPAECAWKLSRSGRYVQALRPRIETFGENVGVLTHEVFGLEVTQSGFHRLLEDAVRKERSFEDAVAAFDGKLGSEARAILQAIIANGIDEE